MLSLVLLLFFCAVRTRLRINNYTLIRRLQCLAEDATPSPLRFLLSPSRGDLIVDRDTPRVCDRKPRDDQFFLFLRPRCSEGVEEIGESRDSRYESSRISPAFEIPSTQATLGEDVVKSPLD